MKNTTSLRSKLMNIAGGIAIGLSGLYSMPSYADTVYYGEVKTKTAPAYIVFDKVAQKSKYTAQIPAPNNPKYNEKIAERNLSVYTAIRETAVNSGYDVVVEKDDPPITNAKDINEQVIKKMQENEKEK